MGPNQHLPCENAVQIYANGPLVPRHGAIRPEKLPEAVWQRNTSQEARKRRGDRFLVIRAACHRCSLLLLAIDVIERAIERIAAGKDDRMANVQHVGDEACDRENSKERKIAVQQLVQQRGVLEPLDQEVETSEGGAGQQRHEKCVRGREPLHLMRVFLLIFTILVVVGGSGGFAFRGLCGGRGS
jgi:hypothetical protein